MKRWQRAARRRALGQTTVETAVLVGFAVAALVTMSIYLQRAYQGYLYNTASSHGSQFDPTQPFSITQTLNALTVDSTIHVVADQRTAGSGTFTGNPTLPGGPDVLLPGRILTVTVDATSDWNVAKQERAHAQ